MKTKQVIVLRKDLNMRKGKMVAQGAHASMVVFFNRMSIISNSHFETDFTQPMIDWMNSSFTKICVSVNSEDELRGMYDAALAAGIPCSLIQDAGLTEFGGVPTYTAVAVGPDYEDKINAITGTLPLL